MKTGEPRFLPFLAMGTQTCSGFVHIFNVQIHNENDCELQLILCQLTVRYLLVNFVQTMVYTKTRWFGVLQTIKSQVNLMHAWPTKIILMFEVYFLGSNSLL